MHNYIILEISSLGIVYDDDDDDDGDNSNKKRYML